MVRKDVTEFSQKMCRLACDMGECVRFTSHGYVRINLATDTNYLKIAV